MGNLLKYSSLTTKIRSMSSDLISIDGFKKLSACESIQSALEELMHYKYYNDAFSNKDISTLHREDIEQTLLLSNMAEFSGLYKFSSGTPRKYLNLVAMYNEMYFLKRILRGILSHRSQSLNLKAYSKYIGAHTQLHMDNVLEAKDLNQFMDAVKDSDYYHCLYTTFSKGNANVFDYALALDSYYFEICFKFAKKALKGDESKEILSILGTKCDFLNVHWISRAKKYYHVKNTDLYATLIPHYYRLKVNEIKAMVDAENSEEYDNIFANTYYGRMASKLFKSKPGVEEFYAGVLEYMYTQNRKRDPYSLSTLSCYLFFRDMEIRRVVEIIEAIRYSLPAEDIITKILKLETRRSFA